MIKKTIRYVSSATHTYILSYTGLSGAVWNGIGFNFLSSVIAGVLPFLSIYFINTLQFSVSQAGILLSLYGLGTVIGGLLGGKLSDTFSPKIISAFFLLLEAITYAILIFSKSYITISFNLFVIGIAAYGFLTANYTWILNLCSKNEQEKFKAIGILSTVSNLGMGLAAILIGFFGEESFKLLFLFSFLFLSLSAIFLFFIKEKRNFSPITDHENETSISAPKFSSITLIFTLVSVLLMGAVVSQLNTTYPVFIQETFPNMGLKSVSILFVLNTFLIVFLQTPIVDFFKNTNKLRLVGYGAFLLGGGMFLLVFSSNYFATILACILFTLGEMLFFSAVQLVCYEAGGTKKKGQSMGLFRIFYGSSRIIGPVTGSALYHLNPFILWYVCGFLGVICWITSEWLKLKASSVQK